jgi:hypothetical protein
MVYRKGEYHGMALRRKKICLSLLTLKPTISLKQA